MRPVQIIIYHNMRLWLSFIFRKPYNLESTLSSANTHLFVPVLKVHTYIIAVRALYSRKSIMLKEDTSLKTLVIVTPKPGNIRH